MDPKLATVVKEGVKPKWSTEAQKATNKQAVASSSDGDGGWTRGHARRHAGRERSAVAAAAV